MRLTHLLIATALAAPTLATAATVDTTFSFRKDNQALYGPGAVGFDESTSFNVGIARVGFGAKASTGEVDADASVRVRADFADTVALAEAGSTSLALTLGGLNFGFSTFAGANAFASVDFNSFLGINPPAFNIIDEGYALATSGRGSRFGTTIRDTANDPITGVGVPSTPGISLQAEVTLDGSKESSFRVEDLVGIVRATHESGAFVTDAFSLLTDPTSLLDLSLAGSWDLDFLGVSLKNSFDTAMGLAASARIGAAVGFGCGDFSTDDDNGIFCAGDTGAVATSPQLSLINPAPYAIDWGTKTANLGRINVVAPISAVPVPASLPLILVGIAAFGVIRRRRAAA